METDRVLKGECKMATETFEHRHLRSVSFIRTRAFADCLIRLPLPRSFQLCFDVRGTREEAFWAFRPHFGAFFFLSCRKTPIMHGA